jgi:hypothetical protein
MALRAAAIALLAVLAAACETRSATVVYEAVIYEAVLPAGESGQRHVRITLKPGGVAALSSAFSASPSRTLVEGTWEQDGSRVTLSLPDERMVLRQAGDQLIAREWDRLRWGEAGPGVLFRAR